MATEYHVATDGSGDYTTINSAYNNASSGDTISLRCGDSWTENVNIQKSITINSYSTGAQPILNGRFQFLNCSNVNISNIHTITQTAGMQGIYISYNVDNITVNGCKSENLSGVNGTAVFIGGSLSGGWVSNVTIKNSEVLNFGTSSYGGGIGIESFVYNVVVENNIIHDGYEVGVQMSDQIGLLASPSALSSGVPYNITVKNNEIYNISTASAAGHGINFGYGVYNCVAEKNYIHDCSISGIEYDQLSHDNISKNNLVEDCVTSFRFGSTVYNNSFYNNTGKSGDSTYKFGLRCSSTMGIGNTFKNNIISSDYLYFNFIWNYGDVDFISDDNLFYNSIDNSVHIFFWNNIQNSPSTFAQWQIISSQDLHSISADPLLNADYTLKSNSPCIGAGVDVGIRDDYAGNPRPQGGFDIGAYEHQYTSFSKSQRKAYQPVR